MDTVEVRLQDAVRRQAYASYDDLYSAQWYQEKFPGLPSRAFELLEAAGPRTWAEARASKFQGDRVVVGIAPPERDPLAPPEKEDGPSAREEMDDA